MPLTNIQALDVVIGCVNAVSGRIPTPTQTLAAGGIVSAPHLQVFKANVVANPDRGVGQFNHDITAAALRGVATGDVVQAVAEVVRANATPAAVGVALKAARKATARPPRRALAAPARPGRSAKATRAAKARKTQNVRKAKKQR
jgi:hypothetical protein